MATKPEHDDLRSELLHYLLSRVGHLAVHRTPDLNALVGINDIGVGKAADFNVSLCNDLLRLSQEIKRPSHAQLLRTRHEKTLFLEPVADIHVGAPIKGPPDFRNQFRVRLGVADSCVIELETLQRPLGDEPEQLCVKQGDVHRSPANEHAPTRGLGEALDATLYREDRNWHIIDKDFLKPIATWIPDRGNGLMNRLLHPLRQLLPQHRPRVLNPDQDDPTLGV